MYVYMALHICIYTLPGDSGSLKPSPIASPLLVLARRYFLVTGFPPAASLHPASDHGPLFSYVLVTGFWPPARGGGVLFRGDLLIRSQGNMRAPSPESEAREESEKA